MAKSVSLHFKGREAREAKKVKEEQLSLRRGASRIAREVRGFWAKLNKVNTRFFKRGQEKEKSSRAPTSP